MQEASDPEPEYDHDEYHESSSDGFEAPHTIVGLMPGSSEPKKQISKKSRLARTEEDDVLRPLDGSKVIDVGGPEDDDVKDKLMAQYSDILAVKLMNTRDPEVQEEDILVFFVEGD
jgi:hypothetical protein